MRINRVVAESIKKVMVTRLSGRLRAKILCDGVLECSKMVGRN